MNNKGEFCIIINTMSNQPFSGATATTHKNFKSVSKKSCDSTVSTSAINPLRVRIIACECKKKKVRL